MQLELRHLEAVCRIAEAGSLGRAAGRLGVSQPALSAQLRRIERVAGGELFLRGRRGLEPHPAGRVRALQGAARARRDGRAGRRGAGHRPAHPPLRLGCILLVLVDRLLGELEQVMAGQEIAVTVEHSATTLTRQLGAGRYDAVLYGEVNEHEVPLPEGTTARTLVPKEPFCVRWAAHPAGGPGAGRARRARGRVLDDAGGGRRRRARGAGHGLREPRPRCA
ncbi:LysR family transcriptional regulator [Streptomyces tanashiensis]